jgi:hypothetical protein
VVLVDHASRHNHRASGDRMGVSGSFHSRSGTVAVVILGEY